MKLIPLGELIREAKAGFASGKRDEAGVVQLRMNNVDTKGNIVWDSYLRVPADPHTIREYRLESSDVLFNNTNSTALVGKSALFKAHPEPVVYSNHFTRLRTRVEMLLPSYLAWWLNHTWLRGTFAEICNQWIGQSAVQANKLLALSIPVPPLAEQERIASEFTSAMATVEKARRAAEERLAAAKALHAAYLREVFEGEEAEAWESVKLGELSKTCSGSTPPRGNINFFGSGFPWVKTGELKDGVIKSTEESVTELALRECSLPKLPEGTLLIAMYGQGQTRGRTGLLACVATTNQACFAILPNPPRFDACFLQFWFRANYLQLRSFTENRGGNQPNLNGVILRQLDIPLPPLAEQQRLAAELSKRMATAEALTDHCRAGFEAIEAMPAALLLKVFGEGDAGQ